MSEKISKIIDEKTVSNIARLAHIAVPEKDRARLTSELALILDWIGQLQEVKTANIEPLAQPINVVPVARADTADPPIPRDDILKNAPETQSGFFITPKTNE